MYTTIDYPGIRKIHIYSVNQDTKEKIPIDIQSIHSEFFKEFESYLSLPTEKNAQNIVRKVFPKHDKPIILEIWTLNYNSQDDTVRKSLIIQHEVQP